MARPELSEGLRGGLRGVALGEALGLPWVGVPPRRIALRKLYEGVGPTGDVTAAALAAACGEGDAAGLGGALVLGWRHPDGAERRAAALALGFAEVVVADLAARALAGEAVHQLVTDHADDWPPPFHGVGADARSVVDALLAILQRHDDPSEGMRAAARLGGDGAATLAAVVGGILGCRRPTALDRVEWRPAVTVPDLDAAVATLARR